MRRCLEREVETGTGHSEVVLRTLHDIPAEIVLPTEMRGESNFETATDLAHCMAIVVAVDPDGCACGIENDRVVSVTPDSAATDPNIRGKPRAVHREAQREGPEDTTNAIRIVVVVNDESVKIIVPAGVQEKSLHTDTKVAMKEVFGVDSTAPTVVEESVVIAAKRIDSGEAYVEFAIRIPLRARRRRDGL